MYRCISILYDFERQKLSTNCAWCGKEFRGEYRVFNLVKPPYLKGIGYYSENECEIRNA
jgi:hypothetical protein